jgi:hypothetical protein
MIILEANRQAVNTVADFDRVYRQIGPGQSFLLRVRISGQEGSTITALTKPAN